MAERPDNKPVRVKLDFRGGGWVLLLAALIMTALVLWRVVPSIRHGQTPYEAALADQPFNGFDVSTCLVRRELIATGMPRDTLQPLDDPAVAPAAQMEALNKELRKYLLSGDRVVGVVVGGEARAYPLRVLNWHEVCNDRLGGVPIAVTYSPLCDSVVVFDRRVGGREARFAVSGLLYNSNLLMYDTSDEQRGPSLWSQLRMRAVAGPAAGEALAALPAQVVYWEDWRQRYPQTSVVIPEPGNVKRYRREPYSNYYGTGRPRYPVEPMPAQSGLALFAPVVAVEVNGQRGVFPLATIAAKAGAQGEWATSWAGRPIRFEYRQIRPNPPVVWVHAENGGEAAGFVQSFWFAWHAMYPEDSVAATATAG